MAIHNDLHDEQLDDRIDRLLLVVEAVWELLAEETGLTNEDLLRRIEAVDLEDGVADRRRRIESAGCACGAKFSRVTHRCDFCGALAPVRSIFDLV